MVGKPRKAKRFNELPRYRAAVHGHENALKELRAARAKGEAVAIRTAEKAVEAAVKALDLANIERFEHVASKRCSTALTAIEDLQKLARSPRYRITEAHTKTILAALEGGWRDLETTLKAALQRPSGVKARRRVQFAPPEPLQLDVEGFLHGNQQQGAA